MHIKLEMLGWKIIGNIKITCYFVENEIKWEDKYKKPYEKRTTSQNGAKKRNEKCEC